MKTTLNLLSFVFLLWVNNTYGQKIELTFSNEEQKDKYYSIPDGLRITQNIDFVYVHVDKKKDGNRIVVAKIKKSNGELVWEKETPYYFFAKKPSGTFTHLEKLNDGFLIFYKREDPKTKESILVGQKLDENFGPIGEEKIITRNYNRVKGHERFNNFIVYRRNGLLLFRDYFFKGSDEMASLSEKNKPYTFTLINTDLDVIWEQNIVGAKDKYCKLENVYLDKDNNLSVVFGISSNNMPLYHSDVTIEYSLIQYNWTSRKQTSQIIDLGDQFKFMWDVKILFDSVYDKVSIVGGFHRTLKSSLGTTITDHYYGGEGIFNAEYDLKNLERSKYQVMLFSDRVKYALIGEKETKKGKLPNFFDVHDVVTNEDGTTTFVLEVNQSSKQTLLLINSTAEGKEKWFKVITNYGDHDSYYTFEYNSLIYVVFNATEESVIHTGPNGYTTVGKKEEYLLLIEAYNSTGDLVQKKYFKNTKKDNFYFDTKGVLPLDNGRFKLTFRERGDNVVGKSFGFLRVE